jgi:ABC-2 type transport system ATP-binding protein
MTAAVSLKNVVKRFGDRPVVDQLSFEICPGEMFGLLGPNGAGKSTTIRMITTLTEPSEGEISVMGHSIQDRAAVLSCIGVVLQQVSVDADLTVWENLEFHGRMHHIAKGDRAQRIEQWLSYMELTDRRNDLVKTLSGGMKRRLQLARALLHQPKILFLDEPTVGLDPQTRRRLWEIIRELNKTQGLTILMTTHYMDEVEYLCDRIGIMDNGQLIEVGSLEELRDRHGKGLVMTQQSGEANDHRWNYQFFPTEEEASRHLEAQTDKTGMMVRASNLEDIFVELTGRNLD